MNVQTLPYIIYRAYNGYGYLTDNRNFGYDTASKSCIKTGDLLLSQSGSTFYSILTEEPQEIETLVEKLAQIYTGTPISVINKDAVDFYYELELKGFVFCGDNIDYKKKVQQYFSYGKLTPFYMDASIQQVSQQIYDDTFGESNRLIRVHLDISSRCNENCIHCYIPEEFKRNMMSEELFDSILDQCKEMGVLNITISGGEPLLNPSLKSFLLKCRCSNFSVNLLSNLTLLDDDLLGIIAGNPLISVQTSLYAMDEDVHDAITRQKGSLKKTLKSIKELHKRDVPIQINCPIMKQNRLYYKEVLKFAQSYNIEADADYSLFGCYDRSNGNLSCRLSLEEISGIVKEDIKSKQITLKEHTAPDDHICPVCKSSLCVSNTGLVYPCEGWQGMVVGNLTIQTLKEIWDDAPVVKKLRSLSYKDFPRCNSCKDKKFCSICLIMNANEDPNGDYTAINPFVCEIAETKYRYFSYKDGETI